jgi:hypothetical protein
VSKETGGGGGKGRRRAKGKIQGEIQPELKGDDGFRVPSWVMIPVGLAVGYFVAFWPGAIFGGVIGIFLWRSRA